MNREKRLMGTISLFLMCLSWSLPAAGLAGQTEPALQQKPAAAAPSPRELGMVYRTYALKHIKPEAFLQAAKIFITDATSYDNSVTVLIFEGNIPRLEELLKKLDVERRPIQFQIFAVVASRGREATRGGKTQDLPPAGFSDPKSNLAGKIEYKGELISLKFKDVDIRDVILSIADFARLNVVFDTNTHGTVTCNLKDIPWDQALDIVLAQNRMGKVIEGKILRIAPLYVFGGDPGLEREEVNENRELKTVLDELKALWNFTTYTVDGPTFLTVREESGSNSVKLVSNRPLIAVITNPKIGEGEAGKRTISIEQVMLTGTGSGPTPSDIVYLNTHGIILKEKGYLVAGVSGYTSASNALILVISAVIK